jgi:hypothetical protein
MWQTVIQFPAQVPPVRRISQEELPSFLVVLGIFLALLLYFCGWRVLKRYEREAIEAKKQEQQDTTKNTNEKAGPG